MIVTHAPAPDGTSKQGTIDATYAHLVEAFGSPRDLYDPAGDKDSLAIRGWPTGTEWWLEIDTPINELVGGYCSYTAENDDNELVTVYRLESLANLVANPDLKQTWVIGGANLGATSLVALALMNPDDIVLRTLPEAWTAPGHKLVCPACGSTEQAWLKNPHVDGNHFICGHCGHESARW